MSPPRIMRRTSWLILTLPFHVAFAGIPVVDGANTSQATISAIQNVVAVTKQIEQYKTQLQQYQNMLQNTAAPTAYIWSEADQTISKLLAAQDTLTYYKTQAGSLEQYLSRYQDTAHYDVAPCVGVDACTAQDHAAIANAQSQATTARKKANDALLTSVSDQQGTLQTDADALAQMQRSATNATGQMQAIQSANQLASAQTNQLLQIRSLLIAQQSALGTAAQIEADRDAQRLAASNRALAGRNSKSSDKEW